MIPPNRWARGRSGPIRAPLPRFTSPPIRAWHGLLREINGAHEPRLLLSSEYFAVAAAEVLRAHDIGVMFATEPFKRRKDDFNVRALFVPEAVIVLRTSRTALSVFSVEGFVADFVRFIEGQGVERTGFTERILGTRVFAYGDIAHVLVRFDSQIPGSGRPPTEGIDSFELARLKDGWRIVSITNERPTPENPIPAGLFER